MKEYTEQRLRSWVAKQKELEEHFKVEGRKVDRPGERQELARSSPGDPVMSPTLVSRSPPDCKEYLNSLMAQLGLRCMMCHGFLPILLRTQGAQQEPCE